MPFIHIKSLPFAGEVDIRSVVSAIGDDFSRAMAIAPRHVAVTWEWLEPGHYAVGGVCPSQQPAATHAVLVDVLVPDFNSQTAIEAMLRCVADSIAAHAGIDASNVFLNARLARSGHVMDEGAVVRW